MIYHEEENIYDYSPNQLAHLSINDPDKYKRVIRQNIPEDLSIEKWEENNLNFQIKS